MKHRKRVRPRLPLLLALLLGLPCAATQGIDVKLVNDTSFKAFRVAFDGESFTFYGDAKVKLPAAEVKFFEVDTKRAAELEKRNDELFQKLTTLQEQVQQKETDLKKERELRVSMKSENTSLRKQLTSLLDESDTAAMRKEIQGLKNKNDLAQEEISRLNDKIEMQEMNKGKDSPPPRPTPQPPKFSVTDRSHSPSKTEGLVDVRGRIQNPGPGTFGLVVLDVSVLDKEDRLLATATTFVSNFQPGTTRSFSTDLEVEFDRIKSIEVAVADYFALE